VKIISCHSFAWQLNNDFRSQWYRIVCLTRKPRRNLYQSTTYR
jgi:hypothetical protein